MKKLLIHLSLIGLLVFNFQLFTAFKKSEVNVKFAKQSFVSKADSELKKAAFQILKSKCNVCHKKKNPFKIFTLKNMDRHAKKIHKQVFVYRRMPKGDSVKLTDEEYQTLKNWLQSKNIK
ncbi:MAG: hypothetical protein AB8F94_21015 [Saprospiraceae bacterium]